MAQSEKGLLFFYDWREPFQELTGDECKALLLAMLDYSQSDIEPPAFSGAAKIAASFLFPALARSKQCARAGKAGGLVTASSGASSGDASTAESKTAPQDKTKTKPKQNETRQDETKLDEQTKHFDVFWNAYPRKAAKEQARKVFFELSPDDNTFSTMIQAIAKQKQSAEWEKNDGQFIPYPATWLNGRRWEDEGIDRIEPWETFKPSENFLDVDEILK